MKKVFPLIICVLLSGAQVFASPAQSKDVRAAATTSEKTNNITPRAESSKAHGKKIAKVSTKKSASSESKKPSDSTASSATTAAVTETEKTASNTTTNDVAPTKGKEAAREPSALALTDVYRIGVGDVLDIRLLNIAARESTLYTVLEGGLLDYPLAGDSFVVAGLTTDEVDAKLTERIKIFAKPQVVVGVREYASHSAIITGLVNDAGSKALNREAVPLYVLLAKAQPHPDAARATIMRAGSPNIVVDLSDSKAAATLVLPGDIITVSKLPPAPAQYFFIGGQVASPGQKDFHAGLTLTQAVLASGGATRSAGDKVKVSRQGADGLLIVTEYNFKKISEGKIPDPILQPGDRVEVGHGH
jgi:protein involved in polysaccharide export with SLBB domain